MEKTKASKNTFGTAEAPKYSNTNKDFEAPRHDLKIIIAKKSSSKSRNIGFGNNKIRLNKPNGSKVLSDFERLRGDVDSVQFSSASSSEIVSTSEMKTTLSKKTGTVSHHDLKLENKSNTKRHNSSSGNNDSHDYYESTTMNEREKEKCYSSSSAEKQQRRESAKHAKNNEKMEKFKASSKSNLSLSNIPKLKIELPSLKTKITVPKTPTDTYVIASKSPLNSPRYTVEAPFKKVRFDISTKSSGCDFNDETNMNFVDQMEYAAKIGLKPVERKVESIILHRKRKKSKHSKETEHSKRPKLHVSSSLDESLKLKLKIMGGKSCRSDKKSNEEEAPTCNLRAFPSKTADLTSINVHEEKHRERPKEAVATAAVATASNDVVVENHKYSVTEQRNVKSGSDQPMVFIPKLVLQKTPSATANFDKKESSIDATAQRRSTFVLEQSKPATLQPNEGFNSKAKIFDAISSSECANQKLMKPPTAKMGSPKQSHISTTFSLSPMRPHSIPASLKLSPISQSPPSAASRDFQLLNQNLKRSLSLGAEKSSPSYLNAFIKPHKNPFPATMPDIQYSKIPPLVPSTSSLRNFYGSMINTTTTIHKSQSSPQPSKLPNINVKDPKKLFPNACSSVEILKIPQKTFSPIANIKLNRQSSLPSTIPLERIRKSAQNPVSQKILPKPPIIQNVMKAQGFHQSPQCSSQTLNYSGIYQTPSNRDISLERYTLELTHDIAKLDRSLSLEKNFEHWEKRKLEEFNKLNELKNFTLATKSSLNQQQNLSVRNIPNPSALMMSRNMTSGITVKTLLPQKETVTSTNSEHSDIEEILSKSTIAKANEKPLSDMSSQKSPVSKVNDKKSIEKLTEYLRLTAAKSKDGKQDDDNNNNNSTNNCDESSANVRKFSMFESKSDKFLSVNMPSVDVICIDS